MRSIISWFRKWIACAGVCCLPLAGWTQDAVIAFGLTNSPLGTARLRFQGSDLVVSGMGDVSDSPVAASFTTTPPPTDIGSDYYGVSVHLGEADSGLYFYPYAQSLYNGALMIGKMYGQVDGQPDELLTTMRAYRAGYAVFNVDCDFTPLGSSNVTFQVFDGETLVATSSNQPGWMVIYSDSESAPRANPFRRLADGSIAAVVELSYTRSLTIPGIEEGYGVWGNRILIRPENPTAEVDFASRLDVTAGAGLDEFFVTEERLGVFGRGHRALGHSLLQAEGGRLTLAPAPVMGGETTESEQGVLIELESQRRFNLDLEPVELAENGSSLAASAVAGTGSNGGEFVGQAEVRNVSGAIQVAADFALFRGGLLLSVYRDDSEIGTVLSPTLMPVIGMSGNPRVIGFDGAAETGGSHAGLSLRLDRLASFALPDGSTLEGNQLRFHAANAEPLDRLGVFSVISTKVGSFTIVGESSLQAIYLEDYLPELIVPASVKLFSESNHGADEMFRQTASAVTAEGQRLVALEDALSSGALRSRLYSFHDGNLVFHGGSNAPLSLFSATGLRVLPTQPVLGQSYNGVGSFVWHNSESGVDSSVTVSATTRVVAFESVTVPADTFQALRMETVITFGASLETNAPSSRLTTLWLVAGIGVVRLQETDLFADSSTHTRSAELTTFNILTSPTLRPTANVGSSVLLSSAGTNAPFDLTSVRWLKDGVAIPNATNQELIVANVQLADAGSYSHLRSNSAGEVSVIAATLRVTPFNDPPTFRATGKTTIGWVNSTHVAVDHLGNTYLAGTFAGTVMFGNVTLTSPTPADPVYIVKYDPAGNVLWAREGGGPRIDSVSGIGVDAAGNIYLAGNSRGAVMFGSSSAGGGPNYGTWIAKMSPAGDFLWASAPGGEGWQSSQALAVDPSGNAYVAGELSGDLVVGDIALSSSNGYLTVFVLKLDASGNFVWGRQSTEGQYNRAHTIALDPTGGILIGGSFNPTIQFGATNLTSAGSDGGFLLKMDSSGAFLQARAIGSGVSGVGFDAAGNVHAHGWYDNMTRFGELPLLGRHQNSAANYLARILTDGSLAWALAADSFSGYRREIATVDAFGNTYLDGTFYQQVTLAGTTFTTPNTYGTIVSKFDRDGNRVWSRHVSGGSDVSHGGMTTDGSGNLYLSGLFQTSVNLGDATYTGTDRPSPFLVKLGATTPPAIQQGPQSQTVNLGESVTFGVTATGNDLGYQWRRNGVEIDGATGPSFLLPHAQASDAGSYAAVVRNGGGSVVSASATLQVITPDAGAFRFGNATYSVSEASGAAVVEIVRTGGMTVPTTISMQTADKSAVAGLDYIGTLATLTFAAGEATKTIAVPVLADGLYELPETVVLRLGNPGAGATLGSPKVATVEIVDDDPLAPTILTQPRDRSVLEGRTAVLSVVANGEAPLLYQWRKGGSNLPGATNASLAIPNAGADDVGTYTVVVRNAAGEVTSSPATLNVRFLPVIVVQPQSFSVPYGESVTLSVIASNSVAVVTNTCVGSGTGAAEARFTIQTSGMKSVLQIAYDFQEEADSLRIYDGNSQFYDIGYPSGAGNLTVEVPAGAARSLEIVINGDASGGNDGWRFSAILVSRPIDFQWRKGNQMIWGGSDGNLTIPVTRMSDAGDYAVLVSDHVGSVLSLPATLTLTPPILRLGVVTEPPGGFQLWWTSPDHLPEFISDLTNANNPDNWSIVPDWFNGMVLPPTEEPRFFRLRMFND